MAREIISYGYDDAMLILQELADKICQKIILSTINTPKTTQQIASENGFPLSSTYKKIRKLCDLKLLCLDRIEIDGSGKKVLYYRSKVRSCQFFLHPEETLLQFEKNEPQPIIEQVVAR